MSCCAHPSMALRAGQAPAREERAREQAASWRADFDRVCNWMDGFCQVSPALQDEPWLGSCLPELTTQPGHPCESRTERPQSRPRADAVHPPRRHRQASGSRAERTVPDSSHGVNRNQMFPSVKHRGPACPAGPIQTDQRQSDPGLLNRLFPEHARNLSQAESLTRKPRPLPSCPEPRPLLPSCPEPRPLPSPPASIHAWFQNLAQRTRGYFQSDRRSGVGKDPGANTFLPEQDQRPQSRTLDGPTAPLHLLRELTKEVSPAERGPATRDSAATPTLRSEERDRTRVQGPPIRQEPAIAPDHRVAEDRIEPGQGLSGPPRFHAAAVAAPVTGAGGLVADTAIPLAIPPFSESFLPAGTLRHSSLAGGMTPAEEDLGVLAERIKRILNEEARRFGIDV